MIVRNIIFEDYINYKEPSMYIACPRCNFKCCPEDNKICQNYQLSKGKLIEIDNTDLVDRFLSNNITKAIIFAGLEPLNDLESVRDIENFISILRHAEMEKHTVIIYTGFTEDEVNDKYPELVNDLLYRPLIIKYGRFHNNDKPHIDPILGVKLISANQYARMYE